MTGTMPTIQVQSMRPDPCALDPFTQTPTSAYCNHTTGKKIYPRDSHLFFSFIYLLNFFLLPSLFLQYTIPLSLSLSSLPRFLPPFFFLYSSFLLSFLLYSSSLAILSITFSSGMRWILRLNISSALHPSSSLISLLPLGVKSR